MISMRWREGYEIWNIPSSRCIPSIAFKRSNHYVKSIGITILLLSYYFVTCDEDAQWFWTRANEDGTCNWNKAYTNPKALAHCKFMFLYVHWAPLFEIVPLLMQVNVHQKYGVCYSSSQSDYHTHYNESMRLEEGQHSWYQYYQQEVGRKWTNPMHKIDTSN